MVTGDLKRGVADRPSRSPLGLKSLSSITEYQPDRLYVYIGFGELVFLDFHLGGSSNILLHFSRQFVNIFSKHSQSSRLLLSHMHDTTGPRPSVREDLESIRLKFKQVPSRKKWDFHKSELRTLYLEKRVTLMDISSLMKTKWNFVAS
jgi:hypothetical protein